MTNETREDIFDRGVDIGETGIAISDGPPIVDDEDENWEDIDEPDIYDDDPFSDDYDDEEDESFTVEDYHNRATRSAKNDDVRSAAATVRQGLRVFDNSVILLADAVKFHSDIGDFIEADDFYGKLKKQPFACWSWSAFVYSIEYLRNKDVIANEEECRMLIAKYMEIYPYDYNAYDQLGVLESSLGNHDEAVKVLYAAVNKFCNADTCALRLADKLYERGMLDEITDICLYGIAAAAAPQPNINSPYLALLINLAADHKLWRKACSREKVSAAEVNEVRNKYKSLIEKFSCKLIPYLSLIDERIEMFNFFPFNR